MICKKCGAEIEQDKKFCGACGAPTENTVENTNSEPAPAVEAHEAAVQTFQNEMFVKSDAPKKKSKKTVVAVILAVVAVLVVAAIFLIPLIKNLLMSDIDKMAKHDREEIAEVLKAISSAAETADSNGDFSGKLGLTMSDYLAGMISSYIGNVNSAEIGFDVVSDEDLQGFKVNLMINETDLVTLYLTVDSKNGKAYVEVPSIINGALELDMSELVSEGDAVSVLDLLGGVETVELSDDVIDEILALIDVSYGEANDVSVSNETLTVDGVSQECTVYTLEIDETDGRNIVIAFLEQLKKSEAIKDFICEICWMSYDKEDLTREEIISEIHVFADDGIQSMKETEPSDSDEVITYVMYVDANGEPVGRSLEINNIKLSMANVKNGKDVAVEYAMYSNGFEEIKLAGKGTQDQNGFTGEIALLLMECETVLLECENVKLEEENVSGEIVLSFGDNIDALGIFDAENLDMISTLRLTIDLNDAKESNEVKVGISAMNFDLGEIVILVGPESEYTPTIPEKVAYDNSDAFMKGINIFTVFARLAEAGISLGGIG